MGDIVWDKLPEKKRSSMLNSVARTASKFAAIDYSKPAHTGLMTKCKFFACRMIQTKLGKDNPEYTDFKYWKANGWLGKERPWK